MSKVLSTAAMALAFLCLGAPLGRTADLPVRTAPPPALAAVPVFTWTGFYAGVNAGATRNASDLKLTADPQTFTWSPLIDASLITAGDFAFLARHARERDTEFTGGGQIGYNQQIGAFVFGAEADLSFGGIENRQDRVVSVPDTFGGGQAAGLNLMYHTRLRSEVEWFGTVRARAGLAVERSLLYVTGGLAFGHIDTSVAAFTPLPAMFAPFVDENRASHSGTRAGWTVGGGLEYAFTHNVSLKGEYLYVDLGQKRFVAPAVEPAFFPGSTMSVAEESKFHVFRAGLNLRFGTW